MLANFILLLIGLALISMSFSVIQIRLVFVVALDAG